MLSTTFLTFFRVPVGLKNVVLLLWVQYSIFSTCCQHIFSKFYDILLCYSIYNKNTTSRKYFLTTIYITKHELYITNICLAWKNRTHVSVLYCTTIRERVFGTGYLKLKLSFHFFKNAKADSPTHTLQFETTHKNTSHLSNHLNPSPHLPFTQITLS